MRNLLIFCIFLLFLSCSMNAFCGQVNTFIYHRFDENRYPSTNISSAVFEQQLEYLKTNNIEVVSLEEIADSLIEKKPLPKHAAALCTDDSYRSFYDVAMPLLRKYGYPMTLFVNTGAVGKSGYLNWSELKKLQEEGVSLGNHTTSHPYLIESNAGESYSEWRDRIRRDILNAQNDFETHLGIRPKLFAYTYGEYSDDVVQIVKDLGFKAAFAQQSGVVHDLHPLFNLPRFPMGGPYATLDGFVRKFKMSPLIVVEQEPFSPIVAANPPVLNIELTKSISANRFNCFVQGDNRCWVEHDQTRGKNWYKVRAEKPLAGRRNKYTLTLQNADGSWSWFSQPWVNAKRPVSKK